MKHFGSAHSTAEERSVLLLSSVGVVSFGWAVSCGFSYCLSIPESLRASPVAAPVELPTRRRIQIALRTGRVRATPCIAPGRQDFIHFTPHLRCGRTAADGQPLIHRPLWYVATVVRRVVRHPTNSLPIADVACVVSIITLCARQMDPRNMDASDSWQAHKQR